MNNSTLFFIAAAAVTMVINQSAHDFAALIQARQNLTTGYKKTGKVLVFALAGIVTALILYGLHALLPF